MSWDIINKILGLAAIDQEFARCLLDNPLEATRERGFQLTSEEQHVFHAVSASNLAELSRQLIQQLRPDNSDQD